MTARIGVWGLAVLVAACAPHENSLDPETLVSDAPPTTDEEPTFASDHAMTRLPRRCDGSITTQPQPIGADEGYDRGSLRIATDDGLRELPLQEQTFETLVVGTVAETVVTQVFTNPLDEPIEAVYTFPLHERAAVDDYWIHIGDRSLHGTMHRRAQAREIYEDAKANGQRAGLLEQERPNVFTQSVANILPGEAIEVQMHVVQPLSQEDGAYTLTLPTVVGPRFMPGSPIGHSGSGVEPDTDRVPDASKISPPVLPEGAQACAPLHITVDIEAGFALRRLRSQSHAIEQHGGNGITTVELSEGATVANRDFELSWKTAGAESSASLFVQDEKEGKGSTFTITLQPPAKIDPDEAEPRDLIFVVDNSGSMSGAPIEAAKDVMRRAIENLGPDDRFTVLRFSESASALSTGLLSSSKSNRKAGIEYVDDMRGMGGTRMTEGIKAALGLAQGSDRVPMVLFLTDGYIGNEHEIFELVNEQIGNARIFGLGVGQAPNRHLLDGLSSVGRGYVSYVRLGDDPTVEIDRFYQRIAQPVLRDVEVDWGGMTVDDVAPSRVPDLFVGQPVVLYGKFKGKPSGEVVIRGKRGGRVVRMPVAVDFSNADVGTGLHSMWARTRIEELLRAPQVYGLDESEREGRVERAIELALANSVLTEHTAFVAVDPERATDEKAATVAVPVEQVEGVAYGMGGLGLVGTGRGGGGTGSGTIGLGNTGVVGKGGGGGTGSGYGRGAGAGFGGRGKRVPRVRMGRAVVTGSIDTNVVRRVVRKHAAEFRKCYDAALATDPALTVRMTLVVTVVADGTVSVKVEVENDPELELVDMGKCVQEAAEDMKFPSKPSGGEIIIRHPLRFSPG